MTKGDISGNGLTGAHFSCKSHGNTHFPAGKKKVPKSSLLSQGSDDTGHHHQRCSWHSQKHWTSGYPYHKPCAKEHTSEAAVLLQPAPSEAFYPPKSVSHMVCPTPLGGVFSFQMARVPAAVVRRDRRGHCFTASGSPLWESPVKPLLGRAGRCKSTDWRGCHQHLLKESHSSQ